MNPTDCSIRIDRVIEKVRQLPEDEQVYFYKKRVKPITSNRLLLKELAATFKADMLQANEEQSTHLPVDVGDEVAQYLESLVEGLDAILNKPSEVHAILAAVDRLTPTPKETQND